MSYPAIRIPFGPQHPALKEPENFMFEVDGEQVVGVKPRFGYIHRGVEKAVENRTFTQNLYLIERVCGICSHAHTTCYTQVVEELLGVAIPNRARFVRTIVAELERIHSHGMSERCLISSFNPYCIRRIQAMAPEIPTAHIYASHREVHPLLRLGQAGMIIPTPYMKPRSPQVNLISSFVLRRLLSSQILAWTVDDPGEAARLMHLGVRGIISNHPSRIKAALSG